MTKEEMAKAYAEGFAKEYREIAYDAFLCGYDAKCSTETPKNLEVEHNVHEKEVNEMLAKIDGETLSELSEKPVPNDLGEAANKYGDSHNATIYSIRSVAVEAFIAGAKWHADRAPLPEDTVPFNKCVAEGKRLMMEEAVNERWDELQTNFREINEAFEAGKKEQKEQMMKEAVEGEIFDDYDKDTCEHHLTILSTVPSGYKDGDKVRIIVLPKEEGKPTTEPFEDGESWPFPEPDANDSYYENNC